jgi:hypothetical protein
MGKKNFRDKKKEVHLKNYRIHMIGICLGMLLLLTSYSQTQEQATELKHYPLDSLEGILTQSGVELDQEISSDGKGSLKISAEEPTVVHLFETGDLEVEEARLLYQAKLRTENVEGQVYLEMWCYFPGKGEFFSRGLPDNTLSGTTGWTTVETVFFLKKGENPDNVKLNLVIDGKGTIWIDDIHLLEGPLQ